ncbi:hypothetical protein AYI69_g2848 [Smittium culicis]|uniref:Uncharacterized protein n=1 Tax=Smittium culicis TaxID=133412 RepID=A0A1R1YLC3_9FUNG|nr:hypothetical protein AYI69_g2848 [Smittium culicis]
MESDMEYENHILAIFVHGFMGSTDSFCDFPVKVQEILSAIHKDKIVECIVYPTYQTKNELAEAVTLLKNWILELIDERHKKLYSKQQADNSKAIPKKINIILCGHSMGGLLISDVAIDLFPTLEFFNATSEEYHSANNKGKSKTSSISPTKPVFANGGFTKIVGILAYDSPFFGISHESISLTVLSKAGEIGNQINLSRTLGAGILGGLTSILGTNTKNTPETPKETPSSWFNIFNTTSNSTGNDSPKSDEYTNDTSPKPSFFGSSADNIPKERNSKRQKSKKGEDYEKGSSGIGYMLTAGAVAAAGLAVAAYYHKDKINEGSQFLNDHLCFVGSLYNKEQLNSRVEKLCIYSSSYINGKPKPIIFGFHCFYNSIQKKSSAKANLFDSMLNKKFIELPKTIKISDKSDANKNFFELPTRDFFTPLVSDLSDEISMHVSMFDSNVTKLAFVLVRKSISQINVFLKNSL